MINDQVRLLGKGWVSGTIWPQRLTWIEVAGIRGWSGQRLNLQFPIIAIAGENGSGKTTLLQAAACAYRSQTEEDTWYPSEFFPDTAWDQVRDASIRYGYTQGSNNGEGHIRRKTTRWLGHRERPIRAVIYIDLNRVQPVATRVGYARIARQRHQEKTTKSFHDRDVGRLSNVMGRNYDSVRIATSNVDDLRDVPVIGRLRTEYSGFHQGSGETMVTELLKTQVPKYGLLLLDEFDAGLHPRAQRRLIRDLAEQCRSQQCQIILTTHSPYVLQELPPEARIYVLETSEGAKTIMPGVSPEFALTKMDDDQHPECDLYVEDGAAKTLLEEILAYHGKDIFQRCDVVPFGASNVGIALGQMVKQNRFTRPTRVFLDGDIPKAEGCIILPGGDAPERVVFRAMKLRKWDGVANRIARPFADVDDACNAAMVLPDHHLWVSFAATRLRCGGATLWQAMSAEWAKLLSEDDIKEIITEIQMALP